MLAIPRLMVLAAAALLVIACHDQVTEAPGVEPTISSAPQLAHVESERPAEVPLVHLARQISGFGGLYMSGGTLVVALTDHGEESTAIARVGSYLPTVADALGLNSRDGVPIQIQHVRYEFSALQDWRDRLNWDVLAIDGVVFTSLSTIQNRLVIGVRTESVGARVLDVVTSLEIPLDAVRIEYTDEFRFNQTLRDRRRPILGGLLLARLGATPGTGCTLGFNARWGGQEVFVTASHCSSHLWSTDQTAYFQHLGIDHSLYYAGYEIFDRSPSRCGLLWLDRCRWSDAAIIRKADHVDSDRGYIARTTGLGSLVIDPNAPTFNIVAGSTWGLAGIPVQMMGSRSGWVAGTIRDNCADVRQPGSWPNRMVTKCQAIADYTSASGDSGAPVFGLTQDGAYLFGLHWGNNGSMGVFSWLGGIVKDLGTLEVTPPGTPPPPPPPPPFSVQIDGPSQVRPYGPCLFAASVGGGMPDTYNWKVDGVTIGTQQSVYYSATSDFVIEVTVMGTNGSFGWKDKEVAVSHSAPECLDM